MNFLVDECLSPELAKVAIEAGYSGSSHVTWIGQRGAKDWELKKLVLGADWTFVTKNSVDFRGPIEQPGTSGQYADVAIHAGLVCLNGPEGMDLTMQLELFQTALEDLAQIPDLTNQVLDVTLESDGQITIIRYKLPNEP
jgi:hypothetical protein